MCRSGCIFFAGFIACYGAYCFGVALGWAAPSFKMVVTDDSLQCGITASQFFWVSSIMLFGGMVGFIPSGVLAKCLGPKLSMMLGCLGSVAAWLILLFGHHFAIALFSRFLLGLMISPLFVCSRVYIVHIGNLEERGRLGVIYHLMLVLGIVHSFGLGAVAHSFLVFTLSCMAPSVILFLFLFTIPESPVFYITKSKQAKAAKALQRLRGSNADINAELEATIKAVEYEKELRAGKSVATMLRTKTSALALVIGLTLVAFHQLTGINGFTFFLTKIFNDAKIPLEPKYATFFYGLISVPFALITFCLIDVCGRKTLLMWCGIFEASLSLIFGLFYTIDQYYKKLEDYSLIPVVAIMLYSGCFQIGLGPVTFMVIAEMFPEDVRSIAVGISSTYYFAMSFAVVSTFVPFTDLIGLGPACLVFTFFNIAFVIFVSCCVPETKGKTITEIQAQVSKPIGLRDV